MRFRAPTAISHASPSHPGVTLVHDEARSFLTRAPAKFDVLQMSLIDTWAATGAGAFTLSENGLYTREGWRVFLTALTPTGVFSVSRWFDPDAASETTRLLSLGVASLLDFGIANPRRARRPGDARAHRDADGVADAILGRGSCDHSPSRGDARLHGPGRAVEPGADQRLFDIASARSFADLDRVTAGSLFRFHGSNRPPSVLLQHAQAARLLLPRGARPAAASSRGNLRATRTLAGAWPLSPACSYWRSWDGRSLAAGRPALPTPLFASALLYFAIIGFAFMLIQIAFLQRFSVYLGHPTYTFSIILFLDDPLRRPWQLRVRGD